MNNPNYQLICERLLGYVRQPQPLRGHASFTHQRPDGGWYPIPDWLEPDNDQWLELVQALSTHGPVTIEVQTTGFIIRLLIAGETKVFMDANLRTALIAAASAWCQQP